MRKSEWVEFLSMQLDAAARFSHEVKVLQGVAEAQRGVPDRALTRRTPATAEPAPT